MTAIEIKVPQGVEDIAKMFCVCGCPDEAWEEIHKELSRIALIGDDWGKRPKVEPNGLWYIMAYLLDHFGLSEHGGSVGGAWITDKGQEVLDFLERWGDDWQEDSSGQFISSDGTALS